MIGVHSEGSRLLGWVVLLLPFILLSGCSMDSADSRAVKGVIKRYNQLLIEGYRTFNMNPLQEVATPEQATKLYYHMAALGEGQLRMDSTLKDIRFVTVAFPKPDEASVDTKEKWDFTHVNIKTGKKIAEEKDFIYEMGYTLKKVNGRWIISNVNTISGTSTHTVIPWPEVNRKGNVMPSGHGKK